MNAATPEPGEFFRLADDQFREAYEPAAQDARPALVPALPATESVYLYHWRFDRGEEFGLYWRKADADAMAARRAGDEGFAEVLGMAILGEHGEPESAPELDLESNEMRPGELDVTLATVPPCEEISSWGMRCRVLRAHETHRDRDGNMWQPEPKAAPELTAPLRMILGPCPVHAGTAHAQIGDDDEWFCLRDLADTAESADPDGGTVIDVAPPPGVTVNGIPLDDL